MNDAGVHSRVDKRDASALHCCLLPRGVAGVLATALMATVVVRSELPLQLVVVSFQEWRALKEGQGEGKRVPS
jgi:hypothetical protein